MSVDWKSLDGPRLLLEASLQPVAGSRLQPTGFPDLGPAVFEDPDGKALLLVESAQSMANRLEAVCWDEAKDDVVPELAGLPYVKVTLAGLGGQDTTSSLLEFHRLNSPYIMSGMTEGGKTFADILKEELKLKTTPRKESGGADGDGDDVAGVVNLRRLARVCFKYDPNSLVHGVFLEKIAGRLRHPRALSAFIEAEDVRRADSGGVKFDRALPRPSVHGLTAEGGYGNVPFHRTEFTARMITAYFIVDLAQLRGYGLPEEGWQLLAVLSMWKVRRFLETGLRLRTACDLELRDGDRALLVKRPNGFQLPSLAELTAALKDLLRRCQQHFASPAVTPLKWTGEKKKAEKPPAGQASKK
jgi:CRISPR-associated protein Csb1